MLTKLLSILFLALLAPLAALAQVTAPTELPGVRFAANNNPSADSNARFAVGLTLDGGTTYTTTARVTDKISIIGKVRPETAHVGMTGELYVVDRVNGVWLMRNSTGAWVPWVYPQIPALVPYKTGVMLTADTPLDVYTGELGTDGTHQIYIGYKPAGGTLYYSPTPKTLSFTQLTATDRAYSVFVTSISPNIIQSRCILCHVKGGLAEAAGAYHVFLQPLTSNLETNFKTFQNLISLRGSSFILSKVTGGNSHGGGVQLTANSTDYTDLQTFIGLVVQDQPVTMPPSDPYSMDPYSSYGNSYGAY